MERFPVLTCHDAADRDANRSGQLSVRQREVLESWLRGHPDDALQPVLRDDLAIGAVIPLAGTGRARRATLPEMAGAIEGLGAVGLPGAYTFFCLPVSQLVLSGDPLEAPAARLDAHRDEILGVLKMSQGELALNRKEQLTARQLQFGPAQRRGSRALVVVGLLFALYFWGTVRPQDFRSYFLVVMGVAAVLLTALAIAGRRRSAGRKALLVRDGVVHLLLSRGDEPDYVAELESADGHRTRLAWMGKERLPTRTDRLAEVLVEGCRYRVYLSRPSSSSPESTLLSIEPLPADDEIAPG